MNKVFLIGNLTCDPELTETSGGIKICRFGIAVNRNYSSGDGERKTDFFNCVAWRGLGENVASFAKKGNKVAVSGSIELRQYDDRDGIKRTAVDIVAHDVEFLTPRANGAREDEWHAPAFQRRAGGGKPLLEHLDEDEDIPF